MLAPPDPREGEARGLRVELFYELLRGDPEVFMQPERQEKRYALAMLFDDLFLTLRYDAKNTGAHTGEAIAQLFLKSGIFRQAT